MLKSCLNFTQFPNKKKAHFHSAFDLAKKK